MHPTWTKLYCLHYPKINMISQSNKTPTLCRNNVQTVGSVTGHHTHTLYVTAKEVDWS